MLAVLPGRLIGLRPFPAIFTVIACATLACDVGEPALPGRAPEIVGDIVEYDPAHVLSATIRVQVRFGDSVAIRYRHQGSALDGQSPAVRLDGDEAVLPLLGLMPESHYTLRLVAWGQGRSTEGQILQLDTGQLPPDLPHYTAGGTDPSPGFVAFAAGMYGLVIDNSGRVVWYHRFPGGPGLNFQPQPTGRYVARPNPVSAGQVVPWVEVDPLGTVTRTFDCAHGLAPRFHDLIAEPDGSYWIMCDEVRTMDLTLVGGRADAAVMGTAVQHLGPSGLLFEWSPFDHFTITDLDLADRTGQTVNWTHGNAIDLDGDGNLVVSFRSLSEITKIDTRTGNVLWRMGGRANQFSFENGPTVFLRQHGLRVTGSGRLMLLDNLGDPSGSRAERYEFDEVRKTVRLVGLYQSSPGVIAQLGGSTQQLPGGRMLVAYGNGNRVEEYDSAGNVVWRIYGSSGYIFRAQRILSLYNPGLGLTR